MIFNSLRLTDEYMCISELGYHWLRSWRVGCLVPSPYLTQCWLIVKWVLRNIFQWQLKQSTAMFTQENEFNSAILAQLQCVAEPCAIVPCMYMYVCRAFPEIPMHLQYLLRLDSSHNSQCHIRVEKFYSHTHVGCIKGYWMIKSINWWFCLG